MSTVVAQGTLADFAAGMGQDPGVVAGWVFEFSAETKIFPRDLRSSIWGSAFGTVPDGRLGGFLRGNREPNGGPCGVEIARLARPGLDADKVEDREAE